MRIVKCDFRTESEPTSNRKRRLPVQSLHFRPEVMLHKKYATTFDFHLYYRQLVIRVKERTSRFGTILPDFIREKSHEHFPLFRRSVTGCLAGLE